MKSGGLLIGDVQPLPGYCVLLADPVIESINALDQAQRTPRFRSEPDEERGRPAWVGYEWATSRQFDPAEDGPFVERIRRHLNASASA